MARPVSPIENALAEATQRSHSTNRETQVLLTADGRYRVADADRPQSRGETLVAMVGAEGETLMYMLGMVA
ncbi:MAG: hypothetical protein JO021_20570 [Alphaproteobacteria bacterium]|nr:hypothetical protein [Alphaproteobacteria bacterium]